MPDSPKGKLASWGIPTLLTLILASAGIIVPIFWDRYKSSAELSLEHLRTTTLLNIEQVPSGLTLQYAGKSISNLSKYSFALVNSGNTPIRATDVVAYPAVEIASGEILDITIDRVAPAGILVTPTIDQSKRRLQLTFPLLNGSDRIEFSILVTDTPQVESSARISGITALKRVERIPVGVRPFRSLPWSTYVVGAFTIFCFLLLMSGINVTGKEAELRRLWIRGRISIPAGGTPSEFLQYVNEAFRPPKAASEVANVQKYLQGLPPLEALSEDAKARLHGLLTDLVTNLGPAYIALAFIAALTLTGGAYVMRAIVAALP